MQFRPLLSSIERKLANTCFFHTLNMHVLFSYVSVKIRNTWKWFRMHEYTLSKKEDELSFASKPLCIPAGSLKLSAANTWCFSTFPSYFITSSACILLFFLGFLCFVPFSHHIHTQPCTCSVISSSAHPSAFYSWCRMSSTKLVLFCLYSRNVSRSNISPVCSL